MKRITILLLIVTAAFGVYSVGWHDAGLLTVKVSNYGNFGSENAGIWPRGTAESYIFGAGIWVGGLARDTAVVALANGVDSLAVSLRVGSTVGFDPARGIVRVGNEYLLYRATTDTSFDSCVRGLAGSRALPHASGDSLFQTAPRVSLGYDPSTGNSELAPGDLPNEPGYTDTLDRVFFSDNPLDTALWPLRSPGGDKVIVSNEDSYGITNDLTGPTALGIKVIQRGYAWYYHYYEDFIFLTYLIINTSTTDTLRDLFTGVCCDADVGDATDDMVGSDLSRDLGYAWDSDFSEAGWAHVPGYIGFDFLESPQGPSGQLGLTAFKILKNPSSTQPGVPDPANDLEAYLTLAGYDHPTGLYHPVDSLVEPTDARFVQCTGAFTLAPQETGRVVIAVIYGADSTDLRGNSDLAQRLYDADFITHKAWVDEPNGGGRLSGNVTVRWRDSSATGAPLLADIGCSHDRGRTWTDIVTGTPSTGTYVWNTTGYPDGVRYLVRVTVYDTIAVGEDVSDSVFTLDNPGNGAPDIEYVSPQNGVIRGTGTVHWWARDPEDDPLTVDLLLSQDSVNWDTIATGFPNTGSADFASGRFHNGLYYLMVRASDGQLSATAHSGAPVEFLNDHRPAGNVVHTVGGSDCISIQALLYDSAALNDHTYEVTFEPIIKNPARSDPRYRYNLRDVTADSTVIADAPLDVTTDGTLQTWYSPVMDGFALEMETRLDRSTFRYTDFYVALNGSGYDGVPVMQGEDSAGTAVPLLGYEWAFRGSNYSIRWVRDATDSLTLEVYDSTAHAFIPYASPRGDGWFFGSANSGQRHFNRNTHKAFYLDGELFWFNRNNEMTIPPNVGDVWVIRSAGNRVPCNLNTWRLRATLGLWDQAAFDIRNSSFDISPNPFRTAITFHVTNCYPLPTACYLRLFDAQGRLIRSLPIPQSSIANRQSPIVIVWDATDSRGKPVPSGIYFAQLDAGNLSVRKKVTLVR
jgi:hypothetical protein